MPAAIPLAIDAFAAYGAAAGTGALVAGEITAGTVLAGVTMAGAALNAIGTITGDKSLASTGGMIGLVGGVGSLANSALSTASSAGGLATDANGVTAPTSAGNAATVTDPGATALSGAHPLDAVNAATAPGQSTLSAVDAAGQGNGLDVNPAGVSAGANPATPGGALGTPMVGNGLSSNPAIVDPSVAVAQGAPATTASGATVTPQPSGTTTTYGGGPLGSDSGAAYNPVQTGTPTVNPQQTPGIISQASQWMKLNPDMTKVGMGVLAGAGTYMGQNALAEQNMQRQMQYNQWARQQYTDSLQNLTIPQISYTKSGAAPAPAYGIISKAKGT